MYRVEYSFRKHRYEIVAGGRLTLIEAERCRAHKIKSLKHHTKTKSGTLLPGTCCRNAATGLSRVQTACKRS